MTGQNVTPIVNNDILDVGAACRISVAALVSVEPVVQTSSSSRMCLPLIHTLLSL